MTRMTAFIFLLVYCWPAMAADREKLKTQVEEAMQETNEQLLQREVAAGKLATLVSKFLITPTPKESSEGACRDLDRQIVALNKRIKERYEFVSKNYRKLRLAGQEQAKYESWVQRTGARLRSPMSSPKSPRVSLD